MIFWAQFCRKTISFRPALSQKFPQMARTGSFAALLCENSGRRAKFPGKLPRSILKAAIPVERAQVLMASYRSVPCVSPIIVEQQAVGQAQGLPDLTHVALQAGPGFVLTQGLGQGVSLSIKRVKHKDLRATRQIPGGPVHGVQDHIILRLGAWIMHGW